MAAKALTDAQLDAALEALRATGGNQADAAQRLGIHRPTFINHVRRLRVTGKLTPEQEEEWRSRESYTSGRRLPQSADECWALLDDFIGRSARGKSPHKGGRAPKTLGNSRDSARAQRIVIASDFHAPFQCNRSVAELIAREKDRTDTLIIAGDFTDSYSYSRFVRYEPITAEMEWAACDALLGQLSAAFPEIVCIEGNHDARLERHLRSQLSPDVMFAIEQLTGGVLDPFKAMAKRYPNVRFQGHQVGRHGCGWFSQFGDLIVSHAEKFSRVPGSALRSIEEWFRDQHDTLGLKPWRVLSQAHTHQLSSVYWGADKLLVESACLCATHGYQLQAKVGGRPQRRGYVRLEQSADGVTDVNSVRLVWLDPELREAA
jgi:predicted phosphodiesterase